MRKLLTILGGALVVFLVLGIAQEWEYFSTSWWGKGEDDELLSAAELQAAVDTLREHLTLTGHFYASAGDPRFAERLSVSEALLEELSDDIEYLRRNHRRQEPRLLRLEVTALEARGHDRAEIRTREHWIYRTFSVIDGREQEPPAPQVIGRRYLLSRRGQKWQVDAWDPVDQGNEVDRSESDGGG